MLTRNEALELVRGHSRKKNMEYHMIEVESIMRALAEFLGEDREMWGLTGLLHDIDFEETEKIPSEHGLKAEGILKGLVQQDVIEAIKAHNFDYTGIFPESKMAKGLIASDAVAGLLVACALVMPSKRMADVRVETVVKKFREADFARRVDRTRILYCEQLGLDKETFINIALEGLMTISSVVGM
jgi:putative nucleotidyltransferase with HDIG domain